MGLDMYAYSVSKEVADRVGDIDCNLTQAALDVLGVKFPECDDYTALTEEQKEEHHQKGEIINRAIDGYINHDFYYWRKFNALHGWMEDLYVARGGNAENFNCVAIRLTESDLDRLLADTKEKNLTSRSGFFWGSDKIHPEDLESVEKFVSRAKVEIECGRVIFYDSWW